MLVLGLNAKLYYNSGISYVTPTWVVIGNAKDVTLNLEKADADVTTRANNGWKAIVGTLKDASVDWTSVWDTQDAAFTAIKNAFLNNTSIEIAVMDGDITVTGSQGLVAEMTVKKFTRNEKLTEALQVDITVAPTYFLGNPPQWMVVP